MSKTIALKVQTREGTLLHGLPEDLSEYDSEQISELIEGLGSIVKNPKQMTYLSIKGKHGALIIHPDDISYMEIHSDDDEIIKIIQETI